MKTKMNIKGIIFTMLILFIISILFINISWANNTGKVKVETAKLREKPNTDSKVLELTSEGDEVEILEENGEWYKVKYKNITGYLRTDLVQVENKEKTEVQNNVNEVDNATNDSENTTVSENENNSQESVSNTNVAEEKIIEKGKYKIKEETKLKIIPLISAIETDTINKEIEVEVTEILNNWVKVKTSENKEGWIITENLTSIQAKETEEQKEETKNQETEEQKTEIEKETEKKESETKTMYVNAQSINVRQKADKTSDVIKQLVLNTEVKVISSKNGWAYVDINGTKGYIAETLLSSTKQETSRGATNTRETNTTQQEQSTQVETKNEKSLTTSANSTSGNAVVSYAKQFLGTKYVYKNFGVNLNRTAAAQYSNGTSVSDLQAGDLVMFGKSGINHVGIYIGGNTFIHAANASRGVTTDTLASGYYKTNYVGARRIF